MQFYARLAKGGASEIFHFYHHIIGAKHLGKKVRFLLFLSSCFSDKRFRYLLYLLRSYQLPQPRSL